MQALILAGGRGMRMRPLTDYLPKPLLYLPGGTLLDYVMAHVRLLAPSAIALVLQYEGEQVAGHLAARSEDLTLIPQRPPLTLLGALASAAEWVREPTLVYHADTYLSSPLHYFIQRAMSSAHLAPAFLVDMHNPDVSRSMSLAQAGVYLLPPQAFQVAAAIAEADSLLALTAELSVRGIEATRLPVRGTYRNVDEPADLLAANRHILTHWHGSICPPEANIGYDPMTFSWVAPSAQVDEHGLGLYVTVGPDATVHNSRLHNCLIFPGVSLSGRELKNTILAETKNALLHIYAPNGHG